MEKSFQQKGCGLMQCPKCGGDKFEKNGRAESGKQRWRCLAEGCHHRTTNPYQEAPDLIEFSSRIPPAKKYLFTAAQNATPVHMGFLKSLQLYAKHIKAELVIIPFRYRNPTSTWSAENESHEWWAKEVVPHLYAGRFNLNKNLTVLGDIKVTPTAVTPLTGLESVTGERSGIVGHTKIQLTTIPTPQNRMAKIMSTTGAVTIKNYSDTKAGKKGEFHHALGAAMVELTNKGGFHLRQISACEDGSFIDLDTAVDYMGIEKAPPAEALVMGDIHADFVDPKVVSATFTDKNSIVKTLKPKRIVYHDLIDFHSRNHHHRNDPITAFVKHQAKMDDVRGETIRACEFVDKYTPKGCEAVIVASNHPEAMARWIRETDWRFDPANAEFYLETALAVVRSAKMGSGGATSIDPFLYWADKLIKTKTALLERGTSYMVKGIELSLHGDKGANGARGTIRTFAKIGAKTIMAHGHGPGWSDGCMQVGTSTVLDMSYTLGGLSGWLQAHGPIYANGKRSLIFIIDGEYRS
jgi:hypothetical protein